jgi:hypothetical protein
MSTGVHCKSPAMRQSVYCYFHDRLHRGFHAAQPARKPIKLPRLDSPDAIVAGLTSVMNGILARKIDPRQAGRILYGIRIAATTVEQAAALESMLHAKTKSHLQPPGHNPGTDAAQKGGASPLPIA